MAYVKSVVGCVQVGLESKAKNGSILALPYSGNVVMPLYIQDTRMDYSIFATMTSEPPIFRIVYR